MSSVRLLFTSASYSMRSFSCAQTINSEWEWYLNLKLYDIVYFKIISFCVSLYYVYNFLHNFLHIVEVTNISI